jgi:DNA-binding response OmpR family regulator
MSGRPVPLILVASAASALADSVAVQLRRAGNVVYVAHSADGCLRVAASVGPDVVLLDPALADVKRYEQLIKAHPLCAATRILHLRDGVAPPTFRLPRAPAAQVTAGPHAA